MTVKTVILGAGSVGCVLGGFLAEAGNDVVLVARNQRRIEAIRNNGLTIRGVAGTHVVNVEATNDPSEVQDAELLILLTKTVDTSDALASISHLKQRVECALSLQNGMLKDEHLKKSFGSSKVIGGATLIGATMLDDGVVEYTVDGFTFVGEFDGRRSDRLGAIVRMLQSAGLKATAVDDIHSLEWVKLMLGLPGLALSSLTRLELHNVMKNEALSSLFAQLVRETNDVAVRDGATLETYPGLELIAGIVSSDIPHAVELVRERGEALERAGQTQIVPSMLQSIMSNKRTELDETIGYVARRAGELGVDTPAIELCYRLIKGIDDYLER